MTQIGLADAQQKLPELIKAIGKGEEFVIVVGGQPVAKVGPLSEDEADRGAQVHQQPIFGSARGKIRMADDFDAPLDDFAEYM